MITKQGTLRCDICNKFCKYFDEWTGFGCADPEYPEPYDASHSCKKCFPKNKADWIRLFKKGQRSGDWSKSRAENEAAEECGLSWVGSNGVGTLNTTDFVHGYRYIDKKEFDRLKALPYWGYCKLCGAMNKNGYCSNADCSKAFKNA